MSFALMDALDMLAELEYVAEDMTMTGSKRKCQVNTPLLASR